MSVQCMMPQHSQSRFKVPRACSTASSSLLSRGYIFQLFQGLKKVMKRVLVTLHICKGKLHLFYLIHKTIDIWIADFLLNYVHTINI